MGPARSKAKQEEFLLRDFLDSCKHRGPLCARCDQHLNPCSWYHGANYGVLLTLGMPPEWLCKVCGLEFEGLVAPLQTRFFMEERPAPVRPSIKVLTRAFQHVLFLPRELLLLVAEYGYCGFATVLTLPQPLCTLRDPQFLLHLKGKRILQVFQSENKVFALRLCSGLFLTGTPSQGQAISLICQPSGKKQDGWKELLNLGLSAPPVNLWMGRRIGDAIVCRCGGLVLYLSGKSLVCDRDLHLAGFTVVA